MSKAIIFILLLLQAAICFGGPKEAVAVAEAIQYAKTHSRPAIPSDNFQKSSVVPPVSESTITALNQTLVLQRMTVGALECERDELRVQLAEAQNEILRHTADAERSGLTPPAASTETFIGSVALPPMSMSFPKVAVVSEVLPAQLVIGGWETGCPNCIALERDVRAQLIPAHWTVGDGPENQIRFVHVPQNEPAPQITLFQNGVQIGYWQGRQSPAFLSSVLLKAWNSAGETQHAAQASYGSILPTLHAKGQIRSAIKYIRQYVGEGNKTTFIWNRSGNANFPLLAKGDWSAVAIFGNSGHIQINSPNAVGLPTKSIGFGYRIEGSDVLINGDEMRFAGLADSLGVKSRTARGVGVGIEATPVGLVGIDDFLFVTSIISAIRLVGELFQPSMDLVLPNELEATLVLNGDTMHVEFQKSPQVKLVELFTFMLTTKKLAVNDSTVHVDSEGSWWLPRWTKSLDLKVQ